MHFVRSLLLGKITNILQILQAVCKLLTSSEYHDIVLLLYHSISHAIILSILLLICLFIYHSVGLYIMLLFGCFMCCTVILHIMLLFGYSIVLLYHAVFLSFYCSIYRSVIQLIVLSFYLSFCHYIYLFCHFEYHAIVLSFYLSFCKICITSDTGSCDLKVFYFSFYSNLKNVPTFPEFELYIYVSCFRSVFLSIVLLQHFCIANCKCL